jgi:hypothetical protein
MKYGRMRGNKREVTIGTAHTVTVNSLIESNKQTNKQTKMVGRFTHSSSLMRGAPASGSPVPASLPNT